MDFGQFHQRYKRIRPGAPLGSVAGARVLWYGERPTKFTKKPITMDMHQTILQAVERYDEQLNQQGNEWLNPKHMVTWLFQECWSEFEDMKPMAEEQTQEQKQREAWRQLNVAYQKRKKQRIQNGNYDEYTFEDFKSELREQRAQEQGRLRLVSGD